MQAGVNLRKRDLAALRLHFTGTFADGLQCCKSTTLHAPINVDLSLFSRFLSLLTTAYTRRIRLASMTIKLTELSYPYGQMDLFENGEREQKLMTALDDIRQRFGNNIVKFWGIPGGMHLAPL